MTDRMHAATQIGKLSALDEARLILSYQPITHLSGPEWRALVERLVMQIEDERSRGKD